jgi:hypothetical protein
MLPKFNKLTLMCGGKFTALDPLVLAHVLLEAFRFPVKCVRIRLTGGLSGLQHHLLGLLAVALPRVYKASIDMRHNSVGFRSLATKNKRFSSYSSVAPASGFSSRARARRFLNASLPVSGMYHLGGR